MYSAYVNLPCSVSFLLSWNSWNTRITPNNNSSSNKNKLLSELIILLQLQFYHKPLPSDALPTYAIVLQHNAQTCDP